ncbi:MAG: hypothetical protein ACI4VP_03715 [Clostridia bacterium]
MDYETLCLIIKCNPGSVLSYKEGLGYQIRSRADVTFAIPDDVQQVGGATHFHLVSGGQTICWVTLE